LPPPPPPPSAQPPQQAFTPPTYTNNNNNFGQARSDGDRLEAYATDISPQSVQPPAKFPPGKKYYKPVKRNISPESALPPSKPTRHSPPQRKTLPSKFKAADFQEQFRPAASVRNGSPLTVNADLLPDTFREAVRQAGLFEEMMEREAEVSEEIAEEELDELLARGALARPDAAGAAPVLDAGLGGEGSDEPLGAFAGGPLFRRR